MGAVAAGAAVASGGIGAFGAIQSGMEAKRSAYVQAQRIEQIGQEQLVDLERKKEMTIATQRASFAARGVSISGSPLLMMAETETLAARDARRLKNDVRFQTYELRRYGRQAETAGYINAIGSLVGAGAQAGTAMVAGGGGYKPRTLLTGADAGGLYGGL